jgi:hypothetical protein
MACDKVFCLKEWNTVKLMESEIHFCRLKFLGIFSQF